MTHSSDESLGRAQLRFQVIAADGRVLSDRLVGYREAEQAGVEQSTVARAELEAGRTVELRVLDPDDDDRVVWHARWEP